MASTTKVNPRFLMVVLVVARGLMVGCAYEEPFNLCSPLHYGSDGKPWGQWIQTVLQDLLTTTPTYNGRDYRDSDNSVYGHATCSTGGSKDDCSSCLETAIAWIQSSCSSSYGATANYPNCVLEYETYPI